MKYMYIIACAGDPETVEERLSSLNHASYVVIKSGTYLVSSNLKLEEIISRVMKDNENTNGEEIEGVVCNVSEIGVNEPDIITKWVEEFFEQNGKVGHYVTL